ncbi:MAG: helix-turn-helix transcriptional regulator [Bacillota bacterium]
MFSQNLKNIRISLGFTQKDLADKLSVSFKTISHWESSYTEPRIDMIKKIKLVLDVSYEELLDD